MYFWRGLNNLCRVTYQCMNLKKVLHQSVQDVSFREELRSNPEEALQGYSLSVQELEALRSGDEKKISELIGDNSNNGIAKKPGYVVEYLS